MSFFDLIDRAADAAIVPSFTRLGPAMRRGLFDWVDLDRIPMVGRVVLLTGPTSGIGQAAATRLARMGAALRLLARDETRARRLGEELKRETGNGDITVHVADLSDLDAVRRVADEVLERAERIDAMIHNAGALLPERRESTQGHELSFATMVLGPFLLTARLLPLLEGASPTAERRRDPARVVWVASGGMYAQGLPLDDLEYRRGPYRGSVAYLRAKRAQVVLAEEWGRRLRNRGVVVHAMHPGWADTPGVEASLPRFRTVLGPLLRTPEEGADTIVWLIAAEEPARSTGKFWLDRRPRPTDKVPWTRTTPDERQKLWAACVELSGEDPA